MFQVCTTAADADYATTGDVMMVLFRSTSTAMVATTQEMDYIGRLARRASRDADRVVGYTLAQQVYSEALDSAGGRRLMLGVVPLVKVLRFFDSTSTADATEICSTDYRVESWDAGLLSRDAGWRWTADLVTGETCFNMGLSPAWRPGQRTRPWLVEYIAGFSPTGTTSTATGRTTDDPTWTTGPTLPDDLAQAVALRAAQAYTNPLGVSSRSVGDLSVSYGARRDGGGSDPFNGALDSYMLRSA